MTVAERLYGTLPTTNQNSEIDLSNWYFFIFSVIFIFFVSCDLQCTVFRLEIFTCHKNNILYRKMVQFCNPTATLTIKPPQTLKVVVFLESYVNFQDTSNSDAFRLFFDLWRVPGPFSGLWARKYLRIIKIWTRDKISIVILALMFWKQVHRPKSEYFLSEHSDRNLSTVFRRIRPFSSVLTSKIGRMLSSI